VRKVKIPECWICRDLGIIVYKKEAHGQLYDTAISCVCKKGEENAAFMARIKDDMAEVVAEENFKEWAKYFPEEAKKILKSKREVGA